MDIEFYLLEKRVQRALFRKYSSCCENWLTVLAEYEQELQQADGSVNLIYYPATNAVKPRIHTSNTEISFLLTEIAESLGKPTVRILENTNAQAV